ncbi:MAG: cadherin-like domain-containing protein, partial [Planctomycetaceae bacterium]|nr:cadherin-like domain-containing protein [Planctomycetaceae bacterium]
MLLTPWLRLFAARLFHVVRSAHSRKSPTRRARPVTALNFFRNSPQLAFERLEDRVLLASALTATMVDAVGVDVDMDGEVDPGDTIRYTVTITETGGMDATNVQLNATLDPNTTFLPASVQITPIALDDVYDVVGNVPRTVNALNGLLKNDLDIDSTTPFSNVGLQVVAGTIMNVGGTSADGMLMANPDGSFTYTPAAGTSGTDIFTYEIEDPDNLNNVIAGQITFNISTPVWFVDNTAPGGGDGSFLNPFDDFAELDAGGGDPDAPGDTIFVFEGSGTLADNITLENNQTLQGEGIALQRTIDGVLTTIVAAGARPSLTPAAGNAITLASGNTIRGLNVGNTAVGSHAIVGTAFGTATINNVAISGAGGIANLNTGTAAIAFDSLTSTSSSVIALDLNAVSGSFAVNGNTAISGASAGGVDLTNSTGTFTFTGLDIATSNAFGLNAVNTASLSVTGAGNIVSTGSGAGVNISNTTIAASGVTFESISVNGATNGIRLNNTGTTGSFSLTGDAGNLRNNSGGSLLNTIGDAIIADRTHAFLIEQVNINGFTGNGINIDDVTGSSFVRSSLIQAIGTGEDGIDWLADVTGTSSLTVSSTFFSGVSLATSNRGIALVTGSNTVDATLTVNDVGGG